MENRKRNKYCNIAVSSHNAIHIIPFYNYLKQSAIINIKRAELKSRYYYFVYAMQTNTKKIMIFQYLILVLKNVSVGEAIKTKVRQRIEIILPYCKS